MLLKTFNKKTSLFTASLIIISMSVILLTFGYLIGASISFLLGFATSTLLLGFGMLLVSVFKKLKTGKVPNVNYDEREKSIAYIAGFTSYIITVFALCIFVFISFSSKVSIGITAKTLGIIVMLFMSASFFISMLIYRKTI